MMVQGKLVSAACLLILLLSSWPTTLVAAQFVDPSCDVIAGMKIQNAINRAPENGRIVVCAGTYPESVTIARNGLTLEGRSGAILDGTALTGTRFGMIIARGVANVTVRGFEIRNWDDPLDSNDASSGILSMGSTTRVRIANVSVHDNAFVGILMGYGQDEAWTIENSSFENHQAAHIFSQGSTGLTIRNNQLGGAHEAIVLASPSGALVETNHVNGAGRAGIALTPSLGHAYPPNNVSIRNNLIEGKWDHGIWTLDAKNSSITSNVLPTSSASMTLGGSPNQIELSQNAGTPVYETLSQEEATLAFKHGHKQPHTNNNANAPQTSTSMCSSFQCLLGGIRSLVDTILPTASAQTTASSVPMDCPLEPEYCNAADIDTLLYEVLSLSLNPPGLPENDVDTTRLASCAGQYDDCLRAAFFDQNDTSPTNRWNIQISIVDQVTSRLEMRFIEAGVRPNANT
ncbi:MAG: right-handed parallel beta-helix repeat-containing protein, partial [Candidatus Thermoplasmatota archaeon]